MAARGIEAIKVYMPISKSSINPSNVQEEKGNDVKPILKKSGIINKSTFNDVKTSVERYSEEWTQLMKKLADNPESLRTMAFKGKLKVSKFRSIYWSLLLRVLMNDPHCWKQQRKIQRKRYNDLEAEFLKNPRETKLSDDNPLSQSKQSAWNQYFNDQDLFAIIKQDVIRTFPGVDFFRKPTIQTAMTNILFYYAREHPYMCYRQGMHEVLAPILFVLYGDCQALIHFKEIAKTEIDDILLDVLNHEYLEADCYSIFSRLMSLMESYYRVTNLVQSPSGYFQAEEEHNYAVSTEVTVVGQLNSIRDNILAKVDPHLHNFLLKLDIPLHVFGIRWLRLLFGREFALLDLLLLWDAMFADSDRFILPNYILVAMLIRIRDKLLLSDYTTCMTHLMRYPANEDVNVILQHALHMELPKQFDCPPNAFKYFTLKPAKTSFNTASSKYKKQNAPLPDSSLSFHQLPTIDTFEEAMSKIEKHIAMRQSLNALDSAALTRISSSESNNDPFIFEGYISNSPELMRLELKNAQAIISITRGKLQQHLKTIRNHVRKPTSIELGQAIDGIDELCSLLDVKFMFPLHGRQTKIDEAYEVNENKVKLPKEVNMPNSSLTSLSGNIETQGSITGIYSTASETCSTTNSSCISSINSNTSYERPDNGYLLSQNLRQGNRKDIELLPITSAERIAQINIKKKPDIKNNGLPKENPLRISM